MHTTLWADAAGWLGFALMPLWPLLTLRRALLAGQAASAGAFAVHYILLGATTGAAMCGLSILQALSAWRDPRPSWARALYAATLPALAILASATWNGWPSAFAAVGLALASAGRWAVSTATMRVLFAAAAGCWLVHDVLIGSAPGIMADLLCIGSLAVGAMREAAERSWKVAS